MTAYRSLCICTHHPHFLLANILAMKRKLRHEPPIPTEEPCWLSPTNYSNLQASDTTLSGLISGLAPLTELVSWFSGLSSRFAGLTWAWVCWLLIPVCLSVCNSLLLLYLSSRLPSTTSLPQIHLRCEDIYSFLEISKQCERENKATTRIPANILRTRTRRRHTRQRQLRDSQSQSFPDSQLSSRISHGRFGLPSSIVLRQSRFYGYLLLIT